MNYKDTYDIIKYHYYDTYNHVVDIPFEKKRLEIIKNHLSEKDKQSERDEFDKVVEYLTEISFKK